MARIAHVAWAALTLATVGVEGQAPAGPGGAQARLAQFDVASIRQIEPPFPTGGGPWTVIHGQFKAATAWPRGVIAWAYDVLTAQVRGGPAWLDSERYDFDARSDQKDAGPKQVQVMLQALLADRLKLAVHRETQELQVYTLTIGKNGSKMEVSKDGFKNYINWTGPGQVEFTECNMLGLINVLTGMLGAPVIDQTGLKGQYTFKLEFTDPRLLTAGQPAGESRPDLFTAVQDQIGLKLEGKKAPAEVLIIDHIERPSAN